VSTRRVLVTGATGYIATLLLPALRERYALTLIDVKNIDRQGHVVDDVELLDLLDDRNDRLEELCTGVDTIVHCGFRRPTEPATYAAERANVDMTARVFDAAAATNVQRVVCTSTNQASNLNDTYWATSYCVASIGSPMPIHPPATRSRPRPRLPRAVHWSSPCRTPGVRRGCETR